MNDSYQAVYDATRSRITNGNVGNAVREAARQAFDISRLLAHAQQEIYAISQELRRPSVLYKPRMYPDGTKWCVLLGDDLMSGVSGFGDTPAEAATAFDKAWNESLTPKAAKIVRDIEEEDRREEEINNGPFGVGA